MTKRVRGTGDVEFAACRVQEVHTGEPSGVNTQGGGGRERRKARGEVQRLSGYQWHPVSSMVFTETDLAAASIVESFFDPLNLIGL